MRINHWLEFLLLGISLPACSPVLQAQTTDQPATCESQLKEWKDWAASNVPKCNECFKENDRLTARNEQLEYQRGQLPFWGVCAFGFGAGIYSIVLLARRIRRMRPFSRARKKLFTLLGASIWVTLSVLAQSGKAEYHPVNALAGSIFWSVPVLSLAGVLLWWFNRAEDRTTT